MTITQAADAVAQFDTIRDSPFDVPRCRKAVDELAASTDRARVVQLAQEFIQSVTRR